MIIFYICHYNVKYENKIRTSGKLRKAKQGDFIMTTKFVVNDGSDSKPRIILDGDSGGGLHSSSLTIGQENKVSSLVLKSEGRTEFQVSAMEGLCSLRIGGYKPAGGVPGSPSKGSIRVANDTGVNIFTLDGNTGELEARNKDDKVVFKVNSDGAGLRIGPSTSSDTGGVFKVRNKAGVDIFNISSDISAMRIGPTGASDTGGEFTVRNKAGVDIFHIDPGDESMPTFRIGPAPGSPITTGGRFIVRDKDSNDALRLDGDTVDITLFNADCAEQFDISESQSLIVQPGTVMVIDHEGKLQICSAPYDKRVAGVVSGAGKIKPGISLGK